MAAALVDYQKRELTVEEIAIKHFVSSATLTVWAKKAGLPLRNRGRKKQEAPNARQMEIIKLASVYRYDQVGERFKMAKQSVHRIVKRWRNWAQPQRAPYEPGDIVTWRNKRFIVIDADRQSGTLQDEKTGKRYVNFIWNGGRMPKKIGTNPKYFKPTASAATA